MRLEPHFNIGCIFKIYFIFLNNVKLFAVLKGTYKLLSAYVWFCKEGYFYIWTTVLDANMGGGHLPNVFL